MSNSIAQQNKTESNPPPLQIWEPPQHNNNNPTHGTILTVTRNSNADIKNKRQQRDYYRQVNHVVVEDPITKAKWSHMPITFSVEDINLALFPHTNALVVTVYIDRWDITRILIDNGSQAEILFLSVFEKMGYNQKQLKKPMKPLYGFGSKRIEHVSVITLPISFGTPQNPKTEYITFDVVDMHYMYNAIFRRGLLNTFKVQGTSTLKY
jgi:hypothetical protein